MSHSQLGHGPIPLRWTKDWDAKMLDLLDSGVRARAVADRLTAEGFPATKNAVLGRSFRLRAKRTEVPFAETTNRQCMWIEKDAKDNPVMCCGKKTALGQPWCPDHYSICFRPPVPWERTAVRVPKPPKTVEAA